MQKSMLAAAFLLPLLVLIPFSAYAQTKSPPITELHVSGMTISDDGMAVYVVDGTGITRLALSSAFDITSATEQSRQAIPSSTIFSIQAVAISNDGSRIFIGNNVFSGPEVVQVPVMADRSISTPNNPPSCCDFRSSGMTISRDGMWLLVGGDGNGLRSYQLGTPFDISTGVTQNSTSTQPRSFTGMSISNDGMSLFTLSGSSVNQYALSTPYVASSINITPVDTFQIEISGFSGRDMDFSSDGMNMYVLDTNNDEVVHQYPLTAAFTLPGATSDTTPPTVTISSEQVDDGGVTDEDTITLIATFDEAITGSTFTPSDVTVTGDSDHDVDRVQRLSDLRYEIDIAHDDEDPNIAVSIAANKFADLNGNTNTAASNTFRYGFQFDLPADTTPPTVTITASDGTNDLANGATTSASLITFTVQFSADVTGFEDTDIVLSGTADGGNPRIVLGTFTPVNAAQYTFNVIRGFSDGTILVSIGAGAASSVSGSIESLAATPFTVTIGTDNTPPTVTISSDQVNEGEVTNIDPITLIATFDEAIDATTFTTSDVTVDGDAPHTVLSIRPQGPSVFHILIEHDDDDINIDVFIASGMFDDLNGNTNTAASNTFEYGFQINLPPADTTPPTVTISSEQVDDGGVTDADPLTLIATFDEPIDISTFRPSDIIAAGDATHSVLTPIRAVSELRYEIDIEHDDEDPNIAVSIAANMFDDLNGNTNTAPSNTFQYGFQFVLPPVDTTPPTIILPIIPAQHAVNEAISLQFGLVSGVAADYTLAGAPASAAITSGGAFTWTPAATGNFEFDVVATSTGGTDIEPVTLRIVNTVRPFTLNNTLVSDQIFENTTVVNPTSVDFSKNGTLMFVTELDDGDITQYSTSGTPFDFGNTTGDINSAIVRGPVTVIPPADSADVAFSNDGRTMVVLGTPRTLYEYSLDSPYDVASLSEVHTYRISGISGGIAGFTFSSDGTKLFVLGGGVSDITAYEYDLGIPFSISDVTLIGNSGVLRDSEPRAIGFPHDIAFRSDGTAMFVMEQFSATFHEYALSTPFSIASVTHLGNFTVHPQTGNVRSLSLSSDDQRAFTFGISRGNVYGFTLPDIDAPTVQITSTTAEGATVGGRAAFTAVFSEDVTGLLENEIIVDSSDNVARPALTFVMINGTHYTFEVLRGTADATVTVSIPHGAAQSATNIDNIVSNTYSVNLEFLAPQFDYSLVFPPHTETYTRPLDLAFSENGRRLFILETGGIGEDRVIMHNLATAFDISTRFDNIADTFNVNMESAPTGLEFSEDGTRMFITGTQQDRVQEFAIGNTGTAFTLSDYASTRVDSFPRGSDRFSDNTPDGLDFSDNGMHMYITGNQQNRIYWYTLGTAFDLTSITEPAVVSSALGTNNPMDSIINADGSILYVLSGQGVNGFRSLHVYSLGTAYDVSDLTLIGERHPLTTATVTGMVLSPDSNTLYVTERSTDRILEFTLNTTPPVLGAVNFAFTEDDDVSANQIPGSDVDGTALTYRISDNPSWLTINSTGGLVGIVPQDNTDLYRPEDTPARCTDQGSVSFTVTVSDDGFDSDTMDDVERTYTVGVFNSERLNNVLPVNVDNVGVPLAINAVQLDLSVYTSDDPEDTLTYSLSGVTGNAINSGSFAVDSDTGILTFMPTGNEDGTATIDYLVCDGSDFATLQVTTVADVADTFVMFTDFTLREPLGHDFVVSIAEFDRHRVIEAPYGELIEYVNEWDDPLPFNGENTIQVDFDNPVPNEIPFAQRFVIATNEDGQNFVGEFTSRFTVNLRATADSIRDDPVAANATSGPRNGMAAEAGDIIESATATVTFVSFGPTIDASFDVFAPGDDVTIEFPIMPANLNYDIRLSTDALEMIETLGLETGDITDRNPANLALSGTIPDDILPAEVASVDYMIPYGVHLVPGESTIAFPATLNIRIGDMLTIPTAELLREGFGIDLFQLGTPSNATFTATSYNIMFPPESLLMLDPDDSPENDMDTMRRLVQRNSDDTCADLAGQTDTATIRTTGDLADGGTATTETTAMFTFGECPSGGSDDSRWKTKATFGTSYATGLKSVDCGYSMDNICRNVTDYHVNYLRESIETDSLHDFALKTSAPNGLRSLGIAFGVPNIGSSLNAAEAQVDVTLERDYTLNSTYRITDVSYTNENNVIGEDAGFSIYKTKCLPSDAESECVTLNIEGVQFREQMYHAPFVIHAMDSRGYVTIHYMNDGLLISGESLNEPPTHDLTAKLAHQRDLAQLSLTRTDKLSDIWTDQFGYTWTKNSYGTWSYVEGPKIVVSPICDDPDKRVCNAFAQKLAAYNIQMEELRDSLYGKAYTMPAFDDLHETVTIQDIDGDSRERFLADNDLLWLLE